MAVRVGDPAGSAASLCAHEFLRVIVQLDWEGDLAETDENAGDPKADETIGDLRGLGR